MTSPFPHHSSKTNNRVAAQAEIVPEQKETASEFIVGKSTGGRRAVYKTPTALPSHSNS